ncbi:MAG: bifunctional methylenetetrahydrofolate dehydrogenase/methenyltetrahydrofolate cyclohydrolase FolD [Paludibacteraceae bacterium]|nr:bifunctional methylenetetrahydrofolate dehydrogenase/methenyltetrahydrofolate cyclohydrolase FolD [Paludibacteraceae bacterium]
MILDGKKIAAEIRGELKDEIAKMVAAGERAPKLAIVIVGHNPASETYVANKLKACAEVGIEAQKIAFEADITEQALLQEVERLNRDETIDGFIVQLPLPEHITETTILSAIDYRKDVDGLTPENVGRTVQGLPSLVSATPRGIRELLARYGIQTAGKHVVVIGRSNIVGKPMALLLMQRPYLSLPGMSAASLGDATVTVCHSKTQDLASICRTADIIIVAAGSPKLLTADMVREGATVIDVGINRVEIPTTNDQRPTTKLVGDVDFEAVAPKAAFITPVPGGVGPMTIVSLLQNTLQARKDKRPLRSKTKDKR